MIQAEVALPLRLRCDYTICTATLEALLSCFLDAEWVPGSPCILLATRPLHWHDLTCTAVEPSQDTVSLSHVAIRTAQ